MKKYVVIIILFVVFSFFSIKESYGYISCDNFIINPIEINTNNFKNYYIHMIKAKSINFLCSYDYCYTITDNNIDVIINNFLTIMNNKANNEIKEIAKVKGYSITKISINNCS